jgi:type VI secretion system secreted protein VgrG
MLVSDDPDIDLDEILAMPAKFTIHRDNGNDVDFHGMLAELEQLHKYNNYIFYRAFLVPRLWWLSLTRHNQVCLNKSVSEIIELALSDAGLTSLDFEFKLHGEHFPSSEEGNRLAKIHAEALNCRKREFVGDSDRWE